MTFVNNVRTILRLLGAKDYKLVSFISLFIYKRINFFYNSKDFVLSKRELIP